MSIHTIFPYIYKMSNITATTTITTKAHMNYKVHAFALSTDLFFIRSACHGVYKMSVFVVVVVFFSSIDSNSIWSRTERESERGVWGGTAKRPRRKRSLWFTRWLEYKMRHKFRLRASAETSVIIIIIGSDGMGKEQKRIRNICKYFRMVHMDGIVRISKLWSAFGVVWPFPLLKNSLSSDCLVHKW